MENKVNNMNDTSNTQSICKTNEVHEIINNPEIEYNDDDYLNDIEFISQFIYDEFIKCKVKKHWKRTRTTIGNIQMYIFEEWVRTGNVKTDIAIVDEDTEDDIIENIKDILIDDFKLYTQTKTDKIDLEWSKFEEIIGYYLYTLDKHILRKFKEG
jgi:hypothetical protein